MAWTAPSTRSTGDLITASIWNTDLTDNLAYLKTEMDKAILKDGTVAFTANQPMGGFKLTGLAAGSATGNSARYDELNAVAQAVVTGTRAFATTYQNTSGKVMLVAISATNSVAAVDKGVSIWGLVAAGTPPGTVVVYNSCGNAVVGVGLYTGIFFIVPAAYYYRCEGLAADTLTLSVWTEWTLH